MCSLYRLLSLTVMLLPLVQERYCHIVEMEGRSQQDGRRVGEKLAVTT